eukprot:TRINITY_DN3728_c0_g1_i13.p1 TRINITY_DN3728_c0_g1~~TRINITY_DN3728_c0_g1_i13.p1  ORF type:complete len:583 (-),score=82.30 TRINITY_DN3728_c0_g1_i13:15-1763(-)
MEKSGGALNLEVEHYDLGLTSVTSTGGQASPWKLPHHPTPSCKETEDGNNNFEASDTSRALSKQTEGRQDEATRPCHDSLEPVLSGQQSQQQRSFLSFISNRSLSPGNCSKNSSGLFCRICHEGDGLERFVSPCQCAGSVALVHKSCIEKWLSTANNDTCELCRHKYTVSRHPKPFTDWLCAPAIQDDQRNLVGDIICFVLLTPLAGISTYLCATGAMFYYNEKRSEAVGLISLCVVLVLIYLVWVMLTLKYHIQVWFAWRETHQDIHLIDIGRQPIQAKNWRQNSGSINKSANGSSLSKINKDICPAPVVESVETGLEVQIPSKEVQTQAGQNNPKQGVEEPEPVIDLDITDSSFYIEAENNANNQSLMSIRRSPYHLNVPQNQSPLPKISPPRSPLPLRTPVMPKCLLDSNQQVSTKPSPSPRPSNPFLHASPLPPPPSPCQQISPSVPPMTSVSSPMPPPILSPATIPPPQMTAKCSPVPPHSEPLIPSLVEPIVSVLIETSSKPSVTSNSTRSQEVNPLSLSAEMTSMGQNGNSGRSQKEATLASFGQNSVQLKDPRILTPTPSKNSANNAFFGKSNF